MNIDPNKLFVEENAVNRGSFFKFVEIGDRLFGTLTGIRRGQDGFGNEQTIYEILTPEGDYKLLGNKKPILDDYMKHVKLGQIVGFELTERRKTSAGKNPANIITPYADGSFNEDWLKENSHLLRSNNLVDEVEEASTGDTEAPFESTPLPKASVKLEGSAHLASPAPAIMSKEEKIKEIGELAQKKLGATDVNDIKDKVTEATEIAFVEKNLDKILTTMRDL
jgi:hypothetical protein